MTGAYLGIDIGATKSHALICDARGHVLGFASAGTGNHERIGYDGLGRVLSKLTHEALANAKIAPTSLAGMGLGICGCDWDSEVEPHNRVVEALGLNIPYQVVNDSVIGLIAGASNGVGVCVIAGTSCNACGRTADGRQGKTLGMGQMLGEAGGGGELVTRALWAIAHDFIKMGPPTRLTEAFVKALSARDAAHFLENYTEGHISIDASYAPLVFQVAREGDAVAQDLIRWTGRELGHLATAVMRQLGLGAEPFDLVLAGSYFKGSPMIIDALRDSIAEHTQAARLVHLTAPPVIGGVLLGMEMGHCSAAMMNEARERLQAFRPEAIYG